MKNHRVISILLFLTMVALCRGADIPDYSQSERAAIPEQFRWRLEDIYPSQIVWRAEMIVVKSDLARFESMLKRGGDSPEKLADCLGLQENLTMRLAKLQGYASLNSQVQWHDTLFQDMQSEAGQVQADLDVQTALLEAIILRLDENKLAEFSGSESRLLVFRGFLLQVLRNKGHSLSPEAARVASQAALFSDGPRIAADCLRNLDMPRPEVILPDGTKLPLTWKNWQKLSSSADAAERRAADEERCLNLKRFENTFAALLDASVKRDFFEAAIRNFPDCLSAELLPYGVPPGVYRTMVQTLHSHLDPYHRFLRLRKKILGLPELHHSDEYMEPVPGIDLRFSFEEARQMVEESLKPLGAEYCALARKAFDGRWFDVYQHKEKMNLGSAQTVAGVHPFINLDFRGTFFDLLTVTHELGHALSFFLAEKSQPYASSDVVWFASEIPSTFHEVLLMDRLLDQAGDDRSRLALLSQFLERLNTLLFFSGQHAELQLAMHEHVEKGGTLSPAWLNAKQLELERHYQGHDLGVVRVDDYVQSEWNHPNTFFAPFQSYFYVIGAAVSLAQAEKVCADQEAARKYLAFLKSGSSRPILEVFKELGVDLNTPQPYLDALAAYDRLVGNMETLQARL